MVLKKLSKFHEMLLVILVMKIFFPRKLLLTNTKVCKAFVLQIIPELI